MQATRDIQFGDYSHPHYHPIQSNPLHLPPHTPSLNQGLDSLILAANLDKTAANTTPTNEDIPLATSCHIQERLVQRDSSQISWMTRYFLFIFVAHFNTSSFQQSVGSISRDDPRIVMIRKSFELTNQLLGGTKDDPVGDQLALVKLMKADLLFLNDLLNPNFA